MSQSLVFPQSGSSPPTLMRDFLYVLLATARASLKPQLALALENLALRRQLAILHRKRKRPKLTKADRAFWVALCRLWPDWHNALILVKPQTVIGWHRKGFKLYWSWKSRNTGRRPPIDAELRQRESPDGGRSQATTAPGRFPLPYHEPNDHHSGAGVECFCSISSYRACSSASPRVSFSSNCLAPFSRASRSSLRMAKALSKAL